MHKWRGMVYLATICDCHSKRVGTRNCVFCSGHYAAALSRNLSNKSLTCREYCSPKIYYPLWSTVSLSIQPCKPARRVGSFYPPTGANWAAIWLMSWEPSTFISTHNLVFKLFDFSCQHYIKIPKYYILKRTTNLVCKTNYATIYLFSIGEKELHCTQC